MSELALPRPVMPRLSAGRFRALSDSRLSRLAAEGDQRAFTAIYERHQNGIYRYCLGILGHPHDADDAAQATLMKALLAIPAKKPHVPLKPWLYRIAHNEAISVHRRRSTCVRAEEGTAASGPGADEQAFDRQELRQLIDDLLALPERQRSALVMRELSGFEYDEIGDSLGTSAATAKQTVYEARVALFERERGREMSCARIRQGLSSGDRRVLRGRRVASHLRACAACREFESSVRRRTGELQALAPLGGIGLMRILKSLLGGGGGSTGGGGAAPGILSGGASLSSAAALKSAAALATLVVATGVTQLHHHAAAGGGGTVGTGGTSGAAIEKVAATTPLYPPVVVRSLAALSGADRPSRPKTGASSGPAPPGTYVAQQSGFPLSPLVASAPAPRPAPASGGADLPALSVLDSPLSTAPTPAVADGPAGHAGPAPVTPLPNLPVRPPPVPALPHGLPAPPQVLPVSPHGGPEAPAPVLPPVSNVVDPRPPTGEHIPRVPIPLPAVPTAAGDR